VKAAKVGRPPAFERASIGKPPEGCPPSSRTIAPASGKGVCTWSCMSEPKRFVYVLRSTRDPRRYYTGLTSSVQARLEAHNDGRRAHTVRPTLARGRGRLLRRQTACRGLRRDSEIGFRLRVPPTAARAAPRPCQAGDSCRGRSEARPAIHAVSKSGEAHRWRVCHFRSRSYVEPCRPGDSRQVARFRFAATEQEGSCELA